MANYPDTFVSLMIHTSGYPTAWGNTRVSFYAVSAVPTGWFDGWIERRGAYTDPNQMYNWYLNAYLTAMAQPTDVVIDLDVFKVASNRIKVNADISVEPTGVGKNMRVHMVLALNHWPPGYAWIHNSVKVGADKGIITVNAGQTVRVSQEFTLDADCLAQPNDVKVVVFAQTPNAAAPANIYNTAFVSGPIDWLKGDMNCDGALNFVDINPFVLALTNPSGYQAAFPDCNIMNADINGDSVVDFRDINPFVRLLTSPP